MATPTIDWNAVIADPRFQALHCRKQLFLTGLMVFSVVFYFLLPVGAAYFQDPIQKLLSFARSSRFAERAEALGGYDISGLGTVHYNAP